MHSFFERERDKRKSHVFSSTQIFTFGFFCHFFLFCCGKKKKKGKNRWFENRDDDVFTTIFLKRPVGVASRGALFPQKSRIDGTFLVFFGPFEKDFLTFRRRRLWKKTLRTHEERDDDDCIMGAPASETPCTLRGATTGWSSSFDWSRRRPCSISGECKFLFFSLLRVGSDTKLERIG